MDPDVYVDANGGKHPASRWIRGEWAHIVGVWREDGCTLWVVPQGERPAWGDGRDGITTAKDATDGENGNDQLFTPGIGCRGHYGGGVCSGGLTQAFNPHGLITQLYTWKRALAETEVLGLFEPVGLVDGLASDGDTSRSNADSELQIADYDKVCVDFCMSRTGRNDLCTFHPPGSNKAATGNAPGWLRIAREPQCCPKGWKVIVEDVFDRTICGDQSSKRTCYLLGGPVPHRITYMDKDPQSWDICNKDPEAEDAYLGEDEDAYLCPSLHRTICPPVEHAPNFCPFKTSTTTSTATTTTTTATNTTTTVTTTTTITTLTTTTTTHTIVQNLHGRMTEAEEYMFSQIQALVARIGSLEAENKALHTFHADPNDATTEAAASPTDDVAGDAAKVGVDPITNTLIVSAAKGYTVEVPSKLRVGKYHNVEQTLSRHIADQARCSARIEVLEADLIVLAQTLSEKGGE
jgi:hypothetical protein